jgi:hypothetical protein
MGDASRVEEPTNVPTSTPSPSAAAERTSAPSSDGSKPASHEDPEVKSVLEQISRLAESGRSNDARAALASALDSLGDRAALLARAAEIESDQENFELALSYSKRAVAASPTDPRILADHAAILEDIGLTREAVGFLSDLPESVSKDSKVRGALADVYSNCGWYALAVEVVGPRKQLQSKPARKAWRRDWWRSGGPVKILRKWVRTVNEKQRSTWEYYAQNLTLLDTFEKPCGFARVWTRAKLDNYLLEMARQSIWWEYVDRWIPKTIRAIVILLAWFAVWVAMGTLHPGVGLAIRAGIALASLGIAVIVWRIMARVANSFSGFRNSLLAGTALAVLTVVPGILAIRAAHTLTAPYEIVGFGLVAAPFIGVCVTAAVTTLHYPICNSRS